mgnify:CR=1 FL=1
MDVLPPLQMEGEFSIFPHFPPIPHPSHLSFLIRRMGIISLPSLTLHESETQEEAKAFSLLSSLLSLALTFNIKQGGKRQGCGNHCYFYPYRRTP